MKDDGPPELYKLLAFPTGDQMPSKSAKQARTMQAAAHNKSFAKKMGIPQSVAKEFTKADARKKKGK